jgi:glycosyltransferase involved in cell wall biosynthesis
MNLPFHIVTRLHGIGGSETHAAALAKALSANGKPVQLWGDSRSPNASACGGISISPFQGRFPKGGTLILIGTHFSVEPWIDYAKPERIIVVSNTSNPLQLFETLTLLERPALPTIELVYMSPRLRETTGLPGQICPTLIDLERFAPCPERKNTAYCAGRHSRDTLDKHHPDDPSIYRLIGWRGGRTRIMGGTCLEATLGDEPSAELLPVGSEKPEDFLATLDVFFYRTHPTLHEAAGRAVMEALACGLPVIAHESGGYTDWIEQANNGFVFSTQEQAFEHLALLQENPVIRKKMAANARTSAERLSGQNSRQQYLDWLCTPRTAHFLKTSEPSTLPSTPPAFIS